MDSLYNSHYIRTDTESRIIRGFSDAFEQPEPGDICINTEGSYQFRLFPGGVENPPLRDDYGVPLYKWDGTVAIARTPQELEADRPALGEPPLDPVEYIMGFAETLRGLQ